MKRSISFLVFTLFLGILQMMGANVTNNPKHLVFGKKWMEGSCKAQLVQCLHVEVENTGKEDYQGLWKVIDSVTGDCYNAGFTGPINVAAGETKDVSILLYFNQSGTYNMSIESIVPPQELFYYTTEITEYKAPKVKAIIKLDMLERADNGNILYGDLAHFRITGTATITNEEEYTIFARKSLEMEGYDEGLGSGIHIDVITDGKWYYGWICKLGSELKGGETISKDFVYELPIVLEEGKEYSIGIFNYDKIVTQIPFTAKQSTNTYWTADGHVRPLPMENNQVLKVPNEALAVDMRGQYEMNTFFTIDTSEANPNCLYYLGFLDNVPQGFSSEANIIRDYEAKNLVIDAEHDYYCPMPFKAKSALFNYTPPVISFSILPEYPIDRKATSGTVVLPFEAQHVCLTALNDGSDSDISTYGDNLKVFRYKESGINNDLHFEPLINSRKTGMDAYEPYLLYLRPSSVIFYSEEVMIPSTREAVVGSDSIRFIGRTVSQTVPEMKGKSDIYIYQWSCDEKSFLINEYGNVLPPFSGNFYLTPRNMPEGLTSAQRAYEEELSVIFLNSTDGPEENTGIETPQLTGQNHALTVFSLSGQRVGTASYHDGKLSLSGLHPGLYIIGGKKVMVK